MHRSLLICRLVTYATKLTAGIDMLCRFFENCHGMAVLLKKTPERSVAHMRVSEPMLLLAVCSVGARFWTQDEHKYIRFGLLSFRTTLTVMQQYRNYLHGISSQLHRDHCTT
jgi:hypothetical protein